MHLNLSNISKRVEIPGAELTILRDINLDIPTGQTVAIVGASGSGKSTLLGLMAGLDLPSEGQVTLDDRDLTQLDEDGRAEVRADNLGFVFQAFQLLNGLTAIENVMLPLELAGRPDARKVATDLLDRVGLEERLTHYPRQLSGGEQQRVAIARAFVTQPKLLLADEPTGNLDRNTGQQIAELLFALNRERGTTLILVTHDLGLASNCERIVELDAGAVAADRMTQLAAQ